MQIFNTLTRQKEEFVPQVPGEYRIYVCGPTVYNYIHIGNARPLIVFDTLRRYLEYRGNKVIYVSNITDIDDKLIKKGQEEGTSMKEVAQRFEAEYLKDAAGLNCKKPTVQPRATEHIQQILDIVKDLIDSGHAYVAKNGDVYFRVKSDPEYGKLSHLKLDDLESGNRELRSQMEDDLKEDPADFAVWKAAKPGEPAWESPYGMGRPGWHIECSAMSRTHLGKTIDLHCGGQDLIFPHHENEIAQSECANGCEFARYWMHNGFINIDNKKMSKSLGNFFTVREAAAVYGYDCIRMFMLMSHYRSPLNYSGEILMQAKAALERLRTAKSNLEFFIANGRDGELSEADAAFVQGLDQYREKFDAVMDDDFNTADAISVIFEMVREINTAVSPAADPSKALAQACLDRFLELCDVLGIPFGSDSSEDPEAKAIEEKIAVAKSRYSGKTKICCTRYGNVMCSRGSVIPLWIEQIRNGNPVTLTEPTMTRFIMSLEEAVDLVLFAFEHGQNGDILVQKAPACTIQTQAEAVCELFGGKKEDIKVIGIRHGEKMYETLLTNEECAKAEDMGNFYRVPADNRGLNYDKYFKEGETERNTLTEFNSNNTRILNVEETKAKIAALDYIKKELNGEGNFVQ